MSLHPLKYEMWGTQLSASNKTAVTATIVLDNDRRGTLGFNS
jgi:hypothetical protein